MPPAEPGPLGLWLGVFVPTLASLFCAGKRPAARPPLPETRSDGVTDGGNGAGPDRSPGRDMRHGRRVAVLPGLRAQKKKTKQTNRGFYNIFEKPLKCKHRLHASKRELLKLREDYAKRGGRAETGRERLPGAEEGSIPPGEPPGRAAPHPTAPAAGAAATGGCWGGGAGPRKERQGGGRLSHSL